MTYSRRLPFSLSYGVILPSSLTNGYPVRLAIFLPPTCVGLRYGRFTSSKYAVFLASVNSLASLLFFTPRHRPALNVRFLPIHSASRFVHGFPSPWSNYPSVSLLLSVSRYRIIYLLSIMYAFRPPLRSRLTLGGRTFPRKP